MRSQTVDQTITRIKPLPSDLPTEPLHPEQFRQGAPAGEDPIIGRVAFALATERGEPAAPEVVERLRNEAAAALSTYAFRYLHNATEEVRRQAIAEHVGRLRPPPGFLRLLLANLLALGIAAGIAGWAATQPERVDALVATVRAWLGG